jgi:ATP-dependent Clp protease ATP-binding subunit ClpC
VDGVWIIVLVAALAAAIGYGTGRRRTNKPETPPAQNLEAGAELYRIAADLAAFHRESARPSELLGHAEFERGVRLLSGTPWTAEALLGYYCGESAVIACIALEALARRTGDPDIRERILDGINDFVPWTRFFALRVLDAKTPPAGPIVGKLLTRIDDSWDFPLNVRLLGEFIRSRSEGGEPITLGAEVERLKDENTEALRAVFERLPADLTTGLSEEIRTWRSRSIDRKFLGSLGRLWPTGDSDATTKEQPSPIMHDALEASVARLESAIGERPRRPVLLVGEHGVGKTAAVRLLGERLARKGWVIFEAGHSEIMAGMVYIGQLEERLLGLLERIRNRPILWFVQDFHDLALAGRHQNNETTVLDQLLPRLDSGEILLLGETSPAALERLIQAKPRLLTVMETIRVEPLGETDTRGLVRRWAERRDEDGLTLTVETQAEAWLLAQQYLSDRHAPGNVLKLLEMTEMRLRSTRTAERVTITTDDLVETLSRLTGLPEAILDERRELDLEGLRESFDGRVMGQSEAVDCLVERVAMIKAGVTDPTRPLGVFLFAGPTGTGKTEIAKTLADFLFGSPDRMIRLDMSEFQDPESLNRLIGESDEKQRGALVDRIGRQPFSVILLDEFEKAHANVWDLFLQVFDDGRLTDRRGNTADFRNAIVILTSNLGSVIPAGSGLGFVDDSGRFSNAVVMRTIERSFRKEFLNRLDRVVVFQPLGRETMRKILRKELAEAFQRRGLRSRTWAVEWDESAVDFLLERGFTPDLGARPLKRAIERHLLSPLAMTIVNHQYPEGDQFLFVRADSGDLVVEFIDPDAPEVDEIGLTEEVARRGDVIPLARVALDPCGRPEEFAALQMGYEMLRATVETDTWRTAKHEALEQTHAPKFWRSAQRFSVLGHIEYLDRIEAGLSGAGRLLERLQGSSGKPRDRFPRDLVGRLAQQLYLLDAACHGVIEQRPREAFLLVEAWNEGGPESSSADAFARRISGMYRGWSNRRRMVSEVLEESGGDGRTAYRWTLAVSGYAAYSILEGEQGLHLLELPDGSAKGYKRVATRVRVAPQPESPPEIEPGGLRAQAQAAFAEQVLEAMAIVRRYRDEPSPLVRDTLHGWRTGKLNRVLAGDFDLLGATLIASSQHS